MEEGKKVGIDELKNVVLRKAQDKAKKIKEEAEQKAKEIVESAKREYFQKYERAKEAALAELRAQEFRKYTFKIMELNKELLETKQKLIKEIINEAKERLTRLPPETRKESLKKLLKEGLATGIIKSSFVAEVVDKDKEMLAEIIKELKLSNNLLKTETLDDSKLGGILLRDPDGYFLIDNTYSTRLERALTLLYNKINKEVFKG